MSETTINTLSAVGTVTAIMQSASGFPMLRRVVQDKDSTGYPLAPSYLMVATATMIGLYAWFVVKRIDGLLVCNIVGVIFWWLNFFVLYSCMPRSQRKKRRMYGCGFPLLFLACIFLYLILYVWLPDKEDGTPAVASRDTIVAVIAQTFNISGFASPFKSIVVAVKELNVRRVPRMLCWVNLLNNLMWVGYGVMIADPWIYAPNVAGAFISSSQIAVLMYISRRLRQLRKSGVDVKTISAGAAGATAAVAPAPTTASSSTAAASAAAAVAPAVVAPAPGTEVKAAAEPEATATGAPTATAGTEAAQAV